MKSEINALGSAKKRVEATQEEECGKDLPLEMLSHDKKMKVQILSGNLFFECNVNMLLFLLPGKETG